MMAVYMYVCLSYRQPTGTKLFHHLPNLFVDLYLSFHENSFLWTELMCVCVCMCVFVCVEF